MKEQQISAKSDQYCEICCAILDNLVQVSVFGQYVIPVHSAYIRREEGSSVKILLPDPRSSVGPCRLLVILGIGQITLSVTITFCVKWIKNSSRRLHKGTRRSRVSLRYQIATMLQRVSVEMAGWRTELEADGADAPGCLTKVWCLTDSDCWTCTCWSQASTLELLSLVGD